MLGPPSNELVAGLEALVIAAALLGLGYLIADFLVGERELDEADRWGLSLFGLCGFAFVMMLIHLASGGWLFAHPWAVRALIGGVLVALLLRRRTARSGRDGKHLWIVGLLVVASVLIWGSPVARMMPLTGTADTQLHNGWIDQLMSGDPTFGAVLTGDVPNYYPWMFHSLGAITTSVTPGGTPYHSLAPLQLLQVAGSVMALFALGRALTSRAMTGFAAALFGALSGGFGFVLLDGLDVVTDPRAGEGAEALRYQGDLLFSRSYNISFHNLAPPFPRDFAFGLLISFVTLLALRTRNRAPWIEIAAGCCLGFVGLTGGETFFVAGALALCVGVFDSDRRLASLVRMLGPALAIYAVWFVPLVINYRELGGFVSITHIIPVTLPATAILVSWGLVTPLAIVGAVRIGLAFASDRAARLCVMFVATAGALLLLSAVIPEFFGDAFDTLGRKHRYWPILYLAVAVVAAIGFGELLTKLRARSRALGASALVVLTGIAWASPVVASIALPTHIGTYPSIGEAMREEPGALLYELRRLGPGCEVAAPQGVSREVFSYTGFRLVAWTGAWYGENRARIRWADIYEHIGSETQRLADNKTLVSAETPDETRRTLARRYGVDVVVIEAEPAEVSVQDDIIEATYEDTNYMVIPLEGCETQD